jgi:hypothetical protein
LLHDERLEVRRQAAIGVGLEESYQCTGGAVAVGSDEGRIEMLYRAPCNLFETTRAGSQAA